MNVLMNVSKCFFCIIFLFTNIVLNAQRVHLRLIAIDSLTLQPIEEVTFVIKWTDTKHSKGTVYSRTDLNGFAQFEFINSPTSSITLYANHLNYYKKTLIFDANDLSEGIKEIKLEPKLMILDSVLITSRVINSLDTIRFDVDTSFMKLSTKIIDQIKKDPRFSFKGNAIFFKNKLVTKVLLDNMDLSGSNYINLLEQLRIESFKSFEVIQNFHENPLDVGYVEPEVVLNFNSSGKLNTSINSTLNVSNRNINTVNINSYLFGDKTKINLGINHDRMGKSLYRPFDGAIVTNLDYQWSSPDLLYRKLLIRAPELEPMYNTNFNSKEGLFQIANVLGSGLTNRFVVFYGSNHSDDSYNFETEYILGEKIYKYLESNINELMSNILRVEDEIKYYDKKNYFGLKVNLAIPRDKLFNRLTFVGDINEVNNNVSSLENSNVGALDFLYSRRLTERFLSETKLEVNYSDLNEQFQDSSMRMIQYFDKTGPFKNQLKHNRLEFNSFTGLKNKFNNGFSTLYIGFQNLDSKLNYQLIFYDVWNDSTYLAENRYNDQIGYVKNELKYSLNDVGIEMKMNNVISYVKSSLRYEANYGIKKEHIGINSNISVLYKLKKVSFTYKVDYQDNPEASSLYKPNEFMDDSYNFYNQSNQIFYRRSLDNMFYVIGGRLLDQFKYSIKLVQNYTLKQSTWDSDRNLLIGKINIREGKSMTTTAMANFNYIFLGIPLKAFFELSYFGRKSNYYLSGQEVKFGNDIYKITGKLDYNKRNIGVSIYEGIVKTMANYSKFVIGDIYNKAGINLTFVSNDEKFKCTTEYTNHYYINRKNQFNEFNVRVKLNYFKRLKVELYGVNLFNSKTYRFYSYNELVKNEMNFKLNGIQCGISFQYDIL